MMNQDRSPSGSQSRMLGGRRYICSLLHSMKLYPIDTSKPFNQVHSITFALKRGGVCATGSIEPKKCKPQRTQSFFLGIKNLLKPYFLCVLVTLIPKIIGFLITHLLSAQRKDLNKVFSFGNKGFPLSPLWFDCRI